MCPSRAARSPPPPRRAAPASWSHITPSQSRSQVTVQILAEAGRARCATQEPWPGWNPFAAIRYDPARVDPNDVVAPPYDVVGPAERAGLAARSPYNAIHVDLPVADEAAGLDPYENAARIFRGWLDEGVVRPDTDAGLLRLQDDLSRRARAPARHDRPARRARPRSRRHRPGAAPRADDAEGPPGPALAAAQHAAQHLADLGALSGQGASRRPVARRSRAAASPLVAPPTPAGVAHELWPVTDEQHVRRASSSSAPRRPCCSPTATTATRPHGPTPAECRARNGERPGPHDLTLAFVVELSEDELSIRAVHRLLRGIAPERAHRAARAVLPHRAGAGGPRRPSGHRRSRGDRALHRRRLQALVPAPGAEPYGGRRPRREQARGGPWPAARARAQLRAGLARGDDGRAGRAVPMPSSF